MNIQVSQKLVLINVMTLYTMNAIKVMTEEHHEMTVLNGNKRTNRKHSTYDHEETTTPFLKANNGDDGSADKSPRRTSFVTIEVTNNGKEDD